MSRIAIAGAGAWGRALAFVATEAGHDVRVWSRNGDARAVADADALILAIPAQACREVLTILSSAIPPGLPIIIAAKGIERSSGLLLNDVVAATVPKARAFVLSGPSFAADVLRRLPTAVTLAAPTIDEATRWATELTLPFFRVYASDDVLGVEIAGALKNVLAIAAGLSDGRGLGDSARAALTARGFAELTRFGRKLGANPETMTGLSGLGDLLLTCSSRQSRNYAFGRALGEGKTVAQALAEASVVVEGAHTAAIAASLARKHDVDMPIVMAVHAIIDAGANPDDEIARLLARPVRAEIRD
ncbi:MAG: NAD(P)-dependent glycerol-3-phosphate dehydrogenase [Rhizobiales bacterium]|nr:NAD(P)-dependent glycerol-3-phosphate dehydrogenase [Hyphomicrobiales bacterium]